MAANKYIDLLALFLFFCTVVSTDRRITTDFSLGCNGRQDCEGVVAYIKALGDKDTLHYLISSIGLPSALVIRTESSTMNKDEIMIDWESFLSENITDKAGSIKVDKSIKVLFSYGVFFTRNLKKVSDDFEIVLKALDSGKQDMQKIVNGSLNFKFHFFGTQGRASELPHLEYNEDTAQFDFILSNINTHNATLARFAIEAVMLNNWRTRPNDESNGGYIQWKPVCYLAEPRSRDSDTYVKHYSVNKVNSELKDMLKQRLGIPVIIILCGGLFVFFKKRSEKNKGYEQLNGVASDSPFQN
ncbi:hypothetical protein KUTeg_017869 [Tegillarca granosa]|uniref:Uncharacterized protein n=1 Tax=Tegillarca granosa TaxID=220873 RepID=A0ABQ9EK71_TEGGR|nr:hypothetical protein KUTeg_017869 [Tegillarca granosa]